MGGGIVQAIPLTLTVNVPGPNGEIITVEVPIVLSLDIQIALGNVLTTSVVVTPELVEVEPVTPITPTVAAYPGSGCADTCCADCHADSADAHAGSDADPGCAHAGAGRPDAAGGNRSTGGGAYGCAGRRGYA